MIFSFLGIIALHSSEDQIDRDEGREKLGFTRPLIDTFKDVSRLQIHLVVSNELGTN